MKSGRKRMLQGLMLGIHGVMKRLAEPEASNPALAEQRTTNRLGLANGKLAAFLLFLLSAFIFTPTFAAEPKDSAKFVKIANDGSVLQDSAVDRKSTRLNSSHANISY